MLALLLFFASVPTVAQAAPPPTRIERWYEVDLRPAGADGALAPACGLAFDALADALAADRFDGAVLWLPVAKGSDLPREPIARRLESGPREAPIAPFWKLLDDRHLQAAVGIVDAPDSRAPPGTSTATFRAIRIDGAAGALELARCTRPATRSLFWCDPRFVARQLGQTRVAGIAVSERLATAARPELRATQARLDLFAFGAAREEPAPARPDAALIERVRAQSLLASALAARLAGSTPERFDPFNNEWTGAAPPEMPRALRRSPPWLDLEESLLSPGASGAWTGDAGELENAATPKADAAAPAEAKVAGVLGSNELAAFTRLCAARCAAVRELARFLLRGEADARERLLAQLTECEAAAGGLGEFAEGWRNGLAADRAICTALDPWRVTTTDWKLALADRTGPDFVLSAHAVDDERAHGFGEFAAESIGGERLPLSRLIALDPARRILLRTEFALTDPRAARLEISGGGRFTVFVNGVEQLGRFDAFFQPLITTLPLAAGRNVVELELAPGADAGDPRVHLALLPHHIEGITLEPRRALRTAEPVVRLHDPGALAEESLVWPAGRTVGSAESGSAEFPFEPTWNGRTDVWIHALPGGAEPGALEVAVDTGPAHALSIPGGTRWQWLRLPAPLAASSGAHRLVLTFRTPGTRIDAVTLFESGLSFPHPPDGEGSLADAAWRFDPLGAGLVVDLPPLTTGDLFGRAFQVDKGANFQVYVWLRGRDPLRSGETAELDLTSTSSKMRFVVPAGTPYEEWVAVGTINLTTDERVELRARGRGALSRVAFLR